MRENSFEILGHGVYTVGEAATYSELESSRVRWWFKARPGRNAQPLLSPDFDRIGDRLAVSFLDLIDVRVAGRLRDMGVPMRTVRAAYDVLAGQIGRHPFARNEIYTDGSRIFVDAADTLGERLLQEVVSRQQFFPKVRELLTHIEYDADTRLASRWGIAKGVVIDPAVALGKPVVTDRNTTTFVLARQYFANNENAALVADLFGVTMQDVEHAVDFEERFGRRTAA